MALAGAINPPEGQAALLAVGLAVAADAVTLWIAATPAQNAWQYAPRLVIRAPEKRCGKSRLLDVTESASFNPMMTVNTSTAVVDRTIGMGDPVTLLKDEADAIFTRPGDNDDLRGILSAGHQRGKPVICSPSPRWWSSACSTQNRRDTSDEHHHVDICTWPYPAPPHPRLVYACGRRRATGSARQCSQPGEQLVSFLR